MLRAWEVRERNAKARVLSTSLHHDPDGDADVCSRVERLAELFDLLGVLEYGGGLSGEELGDVHGGLVEDVRFAGIEVQPGSLAVVDELDRGMRPDPELNGARSEAWELRRRGHVVDQHQTLIGHGGVAGPLPQLVLKGIQVFGDGVGGGEGAEPLILVEEGDTREVHTGHIGRRRCDERLECFLSARECGRPRIRFHDALDSRDVVTATRPRSPGLP